MAYETPLKIADVMQDISNNKYVLPSIQREYVWDAVQIETLFDSLMQDYPIGTFLFWEVDKAGIEKYGFYEFLKNYHERDSMHNPKADLKGANGVTAVLDGQQRLTSLYIGLKGSYASRLRYRQRNDDNAYPVKKLYLNLLASAKEGSGNAYSFEFKSPKDVHNTDECYWFEVGKILDMEFDDISDYVDDHITYSANDDRGVKRDKIKFARKALSRLFRVIRMEGSINYYKEKSTDLDKVLNIFIRVNSGGTVLTYSDLLLSIASAQWESHDAREEITTFVDAVNAIGGGFAINKDFVLKAALVLSDISNIAFKVNNFSKENMETIEKNWDDIKKAIRLTVHLAASFGYTGKTLSSNNALIPIAYYLKTIGSPDDFVTSAAAKNSRAAIRKWLIGALLKQAFGGQPDTVLRPMRETIREKCADKAHEAGFKDFPVQDISEKFKGTPHSLQFDEDDIDGHLLRCQYGKPETLSTLLLLYPSLNFNNTKFDEDHIYPKSKFNKTSLRELGVPEPLIDPCMKRVNEISNLQMLPVDENVRKGDKDFSAWFADTQGTPAEKSNYRKFHYLPDMDYAYSSFLDFLDRRRELLREKLKELLA